MPIFAPSIRKNRAFCPSYDNSTRCAYHQNCRRVISLNMANKASRTIQEQIDLLERRGMLFRDKNFAVGCLKRISYFRLKAYWWDMQRDPVNHIFNSGCYFEEVIERYEFDNALRKILFTAIDTIEIALRTKLIYHMSQAYGGLWYLDGNLFNNARQHASQLLHLQKEFAESGEVFAKDYRRQHPNQIQNGWQSDEDPDAWIILEVATLGDLSKLYKNIGHQLPAKAQIANDFGLSIHSDLASWLEAVAYLRNIVAHHSRLWSRNMVKRPSEPLNPQHTWLSRQLTDTETKRPFYIITTMIYLCDAVAPDNTLRKDIYRLLKKYCHLPMQRMGFFDGWQQEPIWQLPKDRSAWLSKLAKMIHV